MTVLLILGILAVGIVGLIRCDDLITKVMALSIANAAIILLFVHFGSRSGSEAPILLAGVTDVVDALPQALMLTAIVIGVATSAVALTLIVRIHQTFGSVCIREIESRLRDGDV